MLKLILILFFSLQSSLPASSQVIHVLSPEVRGLLGTGGLQHAVLDKTFYIKKQGHDAKIVMPLYTSIDVSKLKNYKVINSSLTVSLNQGNAIFLYDVVEFSHPESESLKIIGIKHKPGNSHQNIFNNITNNTASIYSWHPNDGETFSFFGKAYTHWIDQIEITLQPDIVILNDWHSGITSAYLDKRKEEYLKAIREGHTFSQSKKIPYIQGVIHNLKYQGIFDHSLHQWMELGPGYFNSTDMHGKVNFLKTLMIFSDYIETVSIQYAHEITTLEFGEGLESITRKLASEGRLSGLMNGIDPLKWNPMNLQIPDKYYKNLPFSSTDLKNKKKGKALLVEKIFKEKIKTNTIVLSLTARLDEQKGFSYLLGEDGLLKKLLTAPEWDIKILITGDPHGIREDSSIVRELQKLSKLHPQNISVHRFDPTLEKVFLYFSDFYFGGSIFEPSGLTQMFSQSVGTIPIVSRLGGHIDSVIDEKSGYLFDIVKKNNHIHKEMTVSNAFSAFQRALRVFKSPTALKKLRVNIMKIDNSWAQRVFYFEHFIDLAFAGEFESDSNKASKSKGIINLSTLHRKLKAQGRFCPQVFKPSIGLRF